MQFYDDLLLLNENEILFRKEFLKIHAEYRRFVLSNLRNASLGTNLEALTRKAELEKNLVSITAEVKPLWGILDKLISQENHALKVAKEVLSPRKNHLEKSAVETWFASDKWKELECKFSKIWLKRCLFIDN